MRLETKHSVFAKLISPILDQRLCYLLQFMRIFPRLCLIEDSMSTEILWYFDQHAIRNEHRYSYVLKSVYCTCNTTTPYLLVSKVTKVSNSVSGAVVCEGNSDEASWLFPISTKTP